MKLITKQLEKTLAKYPLYSQDGKGMNAVVIAKFFMPGTVWTWYALEAEKQPDGDILFYGYVEGLESEYGYFTLKQISSVKNRWGLGVERDMYFNVGKTTLAEVLGKTEKVSK